MLLAVQRVERVTEEAAGAALPLPEPERLGVGDEHAPDRLWIPHHHEAARPRGQAKGGAVLSVCPRVPDRIAEEGTGA